MKQDTMVIFMVERPENQSLSILQTRVTGLRIAWKPDYVGFFLMFSHGERNNKNKV